MTITNALIPTTTDKEKIDLLQVEIKQKIQDPVNDAWALPLYDITVSALLFNKVMGPETIRKRWARVSNRIAKYKNPELIVFEIHQDSQSANTDTGIRYYFKPSLLSKPSSFPAYLSRLRSENSLVGLLVLRSTKRILSMIGNGNSSVVALSAGLLVNDIPVFHNYTQAFTKRISDVVRRYQGELGSTEQIIDVDTDDHIQVDGSVDEYSIGQYDRLEFTKHLSDAVEIGSYILTHDESSQFYSEVVAMLRRHNLALNQLKEKIRTLTNGENT